MMGDVGQYNAAQAFVTTTSLIDDVESVSDVKSRVRTLSTFQ